MIEPTRSVITNSAYDPEHRQLLGMLLLELVQVAGTTAHIEQK